MKRGCSFETCEVSQDYFRKARSFRLLPDLPIEGVFLPPGMQMLPCDGEVLIGKPGAMARLPHVTTAIPPLEPIGPIEVMSMPSGWKVETTEAKKDHELTESEKACIAAIVEANQKEREFEAKLAAMNVTTG